MSPPSVVAMPVAEPSAQTLKLGVGERGVPAVDRLVVDGLAHPGPLAHRVDGDAVEDPGRGVPGEQVVGQRRQQQVVQVQCLDDHRGGLVDPVQQLALGHAADEVAWSSSASSMRAEDAVQGVEGHRPVDPLVEGLLQDVLACLGDGHRLASSSSSRCTRTPRSRRASANASCSCLARLTHSTSSNRYSSWLVGVSLFSSRSGRCRIACRRRPTSESTCRCHGSLSFSRSCLSLAVGDQLTQRAEGPLARGPWAPLDRSVPAGCVESAEHVLDEKGAVMAAHAQRPRRSVARRDGQPSQDAASPSGSPAPSRSCSG